MKIKFLIIPYVALGLVFSLVFGIEYDCVGKEMFPTYYGNPFVFKQKSLGSSMEYYFSIKPQIFCFSPRNSAKPQRNFAVQLSVSP